MASFRISIHLRVVQLLLAVLVLSLSAVAIAKFEASPPLLSLLLFSGIWGFFMSIFALCFASRFQVKPWIFLFAEFSAMGFFLSSAISVAIDSNGVDCNFDPYTYNYYERYYDDYSWFRVGCKCIKAAQVFASISALAWLLSFVLVCRQMCLVARPTTQNPRPLVLREIRPQGIQYLAEDGFPRATPSHPVVEEYPMRTRLGYHFPQVHVLNSNPSASLIPEPQVGSQDEINISVSEHPEESIKGTVAESHVNDYQSEPVPGIPERAEVSSRTEEVEGPDERVLLPPRELQSLARAYLPGVPNLSPHY